MRRRIKTFIILLLAAAIVFPIVTFLSPDAFGRAWATAGAGVAQFFQETTPRYLRERLSIPENPVVRREKLLGELTDHIGKIERELETVAPPATGVTGPSLEAPATPRTMQKSPGVPELRERIERTQELLSEAETVIEELKEANPGQGLLAKAAERVLDRILPAPKSQPATNGAVCPQ